jgi:transcriptional regulator
MTANEIKRLQALNARVDAQASISNHISLTEADVKLMRKAVLHNIRNGHNDPKMVNIAKNMGLI